MGVAISFSKQNQLLSFHRSTGLRRILITHTHCNLVSNTRTHTHTWKYINRLWLFEKYSHSMPQICMLTEAPPTATIQAPPTFTIQNFLQWENKHYHITIQALPTFKIHSYNLKCDNSGSLFKRYRINRRNDKHEPAEPIVPNPNSSIIILGKHFSQTALGYMYIWKLKVCM